MAMSLTVVDANANTGGGTSTTLSAGTPIEILPGGPTMQFGEDIQYARDSTGQLLVSVGARPTSYSLDGTTGRHGNTLNPVIQGPQGLDSRLMLKGAGPNGSLYNASARESFPFAAGLSDGDRLFLCESDDVSSGTLGARQPFGWNYIVRCVSSFPTVPADSVAFEPLSGPQNIRPRSVWEGIDFEARLNTLGSWPVPGTAAQRPNVNTIKSKIAKNWAASTWTIVDTFGGGYEQTHPPGFTLNANGGDGYSQEFAKLMKQIIMILGDPVNYSLADRAFILKWVTRQGVDYFFPRLNDIDNIGNNGGAHFSAQPIWAMWALWALQETSLLNNYGTPSTTVRDNSEQIVTASTALMSRMTKHTNAFDPHPWRRRRVISVSGNQLQIEWDESQGDMDWCNFVTLVCKRYTNDSVVGTVTGPSPGANGTTSVTVTLTSTSGLSANDYVYFDSPYSITAGVTPLWAINGFRMDSKYPVKYTNEPSPRIYMNETFGYSGYNPAPRARYRDYDQSEGLFVMGATAMMLGLQDVPFWESKANYAVLVNRPSFPGSLFGNSGADADFNTSWNRTFFNVDGSNMTTQDWFAANGEAMLQYYLGSSAGTARWTSNYGMS